MFWFHWPAAKFGIVGVKQDMLRFTAGVTAKAAGGTLRFAPSERRARSPHTARRGSAASTCSAI